MRRRVIAVAIAAAAVAGLTACGERGISAEISQDSEQIQRGAKLFAERCSGCHTFDAVGAEGGATKVRDREHLDGPNFNVRREDVDTVLFAIRNGGFSSAIMPENIVTDDDAEAVAEFVAKYAGREGGHEEADVPPESQDAQP